MNLELQRWQDLAFPPPDGLDARLCIIIRVPIDPSMTAAKLAARMATEFTGGELNCAYFLIPAKPKTLFQSVMAFFFGRRPEMVVVSG